MLTLTDRADARLRGAANDQRLQEKVGDWSRHIKTVPPGQKKAPVRGLGDHRHRIGRLFRKAPRTRDDDDRVLDPRGIELTDEARALDLIPRRGRPVKSDTRVEDALPGAR